MQGLVVSYLLTFPELINNPVFIHPPFLHSRLTSA
ncbi:unnamed protein product, partial [Gulo gulo]